MGGCGLRGQLKKQSCPRNPQPYGDYGHGPIASDTKIEERRWTIRCDYLLTEQVPFGVIIF
jgi:hypothetical protein